MTAVSPTPAFRSPILSAVWKGVKGAFDIKDAWSWGEAADEVAQAPSLSGLSHLDINDHLDALTPTSNSSSSASPGDFLNATQPEITLPAWCAEAPQLAEEESDRFASCPTSMPKVEPARRLRHTGARRHRRAASPDGGASPDLEGGVETRSFHVDPYLYPTPANRVPLRQYVSAPELGSQAAHDSSFGDIKGMSSSASVDELLSELGWGSHVGARGGLVVPGWASDHCASAESDSTSGTTMGKGAGGDHHSVQNVISDMQAADGRPLEIDGSLYRRRAQIKGEDMPSPSPIQTSTLALQNPDHPARRVSRSATASMPGGLASASMGYEACGLANSAAQPHLADQQWRQDPNGVQEHYAGLPQGAFGIPLMQNFVAPAQQHAGQESSERTARAVQAALLFGSDAPERRNSLEGMSAFDYPSSGPDQPAPYNHYLLYSGAPASHSGSGVPAGFTSSYPTAADGSASPRGSVSATGRRRKASVSQSISHSFIPPNTLQLEGMQGYAARPQPTVTRGEASHHTFVGPTGSQYPATVPLMPVYLPSAGAMSHPTSAPHMGSSGTTVSSLPSTSGSRLSLTSSHTGLSSTQTTYEPLPQTPVQPRSAPASTKKSKSTPNLRRTPPASANAVLGAASPSPSPGGSSSSGRKIAGTRRARSSSNLRHKKSSPEAASMPQIPLGGFSFVNYGLEDAQELCAAVAPSGSYKVPLKGYGGPGQPSSSASAVASGSAASLGISSGGLPHKAPSAAIKSKVRPRAPVDNSRWIQETGEDDDDDDDDNDDDDDGASGRGEASEGGPRKRRKSEGGATSGATWGSAGKHGRQRKKSAL
ncbi:unnamed protein product [Parajaminaea phylloscopi]